MSTASSVEKTISKSVQARAVIRSGEWTGHTSGLADGHVQGNVVILSELLANDFLRFCKRNPKPCPPLATSYADSKRLDVASRELLVKTLTAQGIKLLYTVA